MACKYYNILLECQNNECRNNEEAIKILEDGYNMDVLTVNKLENSSNTSTDGERSSSSHIVLNLVRSITKGRRQRIIGHL
ncbi:hypothetical protein ACS0TY_002079 [Phlomoides rotata]